MPPPFSPTWCIYAKPAHRSTQHPESSKPPAAAAPNLFSSTRTCAPVGLASRWSPTSDPMQELPDESRRVPCSCRSTWRPSLRFHPGFRTSVSPWFGTDGFGSIDLLRTGIDVRHQSRGFYPRLHRTRGVVQGTPPLPRPRPRLCPCQPPRRCVRIDPPEPPPGSTRGACWRPSERTHTHRGQGSDRSEGRAGNEPIRYVAHVTALMASTRVGAALRCCTASTEPMDKRVTLGKGGPRVSRVGVGTIAWGDVRKGYGKTFDDETLRSTYDAARKRGINFFDTAEVYGYESLQQQRSSEQILAGCIQRERTGTQAAGQDSVKEPIVVGTKYFTIPWTNMLVGGGFRLGRQAILDAVQESSKRLDMLPIPLYMIHFPFPTYSQKVLMEGLREAKEMGFVDAIGVSNYSRAEMEQAQEILGKHGLSLACNQVKYSLLDRKPEQSGLLKASRDLGISLVAHSPLEQGKLTTNALTRSDVPDETKTLLKLVQLIGSLSGGYTIEQVALNYLLAKGAVAIPGCRTAKHVEEVAGALDFELDDNEVAMIDEKLDYQEKNK